MAQARPKATKQTKQQTGRHRTESAEFKVLITKLALKVNAEPASVSFESSEYVGCRCRRYR